MSTFKSLSASRATLIDRRSGVGPHHLAIGKTRKLVSSPGIVHALFSSGFEISHARLSRDSMNLIDVTPLDVPVAFGGGAFCVDVDEDGTVTAVFVHRNRHELCALRGRLVGDVLQWNGWRTLVRADSPMAAPWIEFGSGGKAWASVLTRAGDFRIVRIDRDGRSRSTTLFEPNERLWHHSCVQTIPVGPEEILAVGFRGQFPIATELVAKRMSEGLEFGPAFTVAPCNVNDQLTFHFQAVGDPLRGRGHIVYLDKGLSVSHALYAKGAWTATQNILPCAAYAPQICLRSDGALAFMAVDYDGRVWTAGWHESEGWSAPRIVEGLPLQTLSPAFGQTGYGTGGLITAARSADGNVPFLMGVITDDRTATADLYASSLGVEDALTLVPEAPLNVAATRGGLRAEIRLRGLRPDHLREEGRCWLVTVPLADGAALKIATLWSNGRLSARASIMEGDGATRPMPGPVEVVPRWHDAFRPASEGHATLSVMLEELEGTPRCDAATVEIYARGWQPDGGQGVLADLGPFVPEAAAVTARDPSIIPALFKRIV